jgi:hypothetical protein
MKCALCLAHGFDAPATRNLDAVPCGTEHWARCIELSSKAPPVAPAVRRVELGNIVEIAASAAHPPPGATLH